MESAGVMCVRVSERGKWHVLGSPLAQMTPCNEKIPTGSPQRVLELVDSGDRCRTPGCIEARNKAAGLT